MVYQIEAIPINLSDLRGHSQTASLFESNFSYSCAAINKMSTDTVRHTVPQQ